jgi:hypothetical protein
MRYNGDRLDIRTEDADMTDITALCGALQQMIGMEAYRCGRTLDEVKDGMLDIHLAAMGALTEQIIKERGGTDGRG